jgi:hypothetical protein
MHDRLRAAAFLLLAALTVMAFGPVGTRAQDVTPAAGEGLPVPPEECVIERRSLASLPDPSLATPAPTRAATPETFTFPEGTPADQETVDAVTSAIRQSLACGNAGDSLRLFSTLTDSYIASLMVDAGLPAMSPAIYDYLATPIPTPVETQVSLDSVEQVQVLLDGRIGAVVVTTDTETTRNFVVLVERDGHYLIDRVTPIPEATATPAA